MACLSISIGHQHSRHLPLGVVFGNNPGPSRCRIGGRRVDRNVIGRIGIDNVRVFDGMLEAAVPGEPRGTQGSELE